MKRPSEARVLAARAGSALRAGRRDEAALLARRALETEPPEAETLSMLSTILLSLGDSANAAVLMEAAIGRVSAAAPAAWYLGLGDALAGRGQRDEALDAYRRAVAAAPEDIGGVRALARALQSVHDVPAAADAWRQVVALAPDDWEAHNDLGAALTELRDFDAAQAAFDTARASAPNEPTVLVNRATLDLRRGRGGDAVSALEACVAAHPGFAPAVLGLGFALREQGRLDDATHALRRALELLPTDATAACGLSRVLLENDRAAEASDVAKAHLAHAPGHAGALAAEALARRALGDTPAVDALLDHERLITSVELDVPDGFADLDAFNRAFSAHAAAHPSLVRSPVSHATTGALHSGSLLVAPRGPVAPFERALRTAIASYSRGLPSLPDHPFIAGRPRAACLEVWCVVMERGGHQTPHIHPSSWLSGVYYPEVPEAIRTGTGPEGWLEFGDADRPFPSRLAPRVTRIRPVEGLLVLFPSYFYHRTVPFDGPGRRISVAFDLFPA